MRTFYFCRSGMVLKHSCQKNCIHRGLGKWKISPTERSELVLGDEILDGLKVVGLQMILIGWGVDAGWCESFARPRPCLRDCVLKMLFCFLRMLLFLLPK